MTPLSQSSDLTSRVNHDPVNTVLALFEPQGSIFQNGFLGGVLLIFDLPGVVFEMGFY